MYTSKHIKMEKTKITVREHITTEKEIEVYLPYYYKHDLYSDSVIYGRIDGKMATTIHEKQDQYGKISYDIEKGIWSGDGSYFSDGHKSTEVEYNKAKERLKDFFNGV